MKVELLAPGGSLAGVKAAINAGADAVYTGGTMFGAREYADNLSTEEMIEAINYAHIHGRKIYLTVNTLLKDREIEEKLYDYLLPFYENGLDAVIVQDLGVMKFIHDNFKNLPIHASTQMTIMGEKTTEFLKKYEVTRIVTPRELSIKEIKNIHDSTQMEIESFVHGALCYCYSGQCFLSSYIGGRSGNRGKCAQPCRLNYDVLSGKNILNNGDNKYVLSPKDICTLEILPEIIEAGVYSLKIEGRMKKTEYTAGITALYRKYIDLYLEKGKDEYRVSREDMQKALDLFNRNGFSESYYKMHNGKEMISLKKPSFRMENTEFINTIREKYIDKEPKENINIYISILKNQNVNIVATMGHLCVEVTGGMPEEAKKAPLSKETVEKQMSKLGNTPFFAEHIEVTIDDGLFLTMGELNELRRQMTDRLKTAIINESHRNTVSVCSECKSAQKVENNKKTEISVLVSNIEQAKTIIKDNRVDTMYIEAYSLNAEEAKDIISSVEKTTIRLFLAMPHVFRMDDEQKFSTKFKDMLSCFDGFLVRNIEEYFYLQKIKYHKQIVFDYNVYSYNGYSKKVFEDLNSDIKTTVPVELNGKELYQRGCFGEEIVVYGYMPVMTAANCVAKTCDKCNKNNGNYRLKDRMSQMMNVKCVCEYCYNIIYNSKKLSLLKYGKDILELGVDSVRLEFTTEKDKEITEVISLFEQTFADGNEADGDIAESTRGHFKRGVK